MNAPLPDSPEDPGLSALLAILPADPAPPGFRDAVLAALDDAPVDPVEIARPPQLRRAARFAGGVAVTAAALGLVAVLWPDGADEADAVVLREAAPREDPDRGDAAEELSDAGTAAFAPAPGESAAMTDAAGTDFGAAAGETAIPPVRRPVRVILVSSPSVPTQRTAAATFETAAARNAIAPLPRRGRFSAEDGPGSIGVLVLAEPDRLDETLREWREVLDEREDTAHVTLADAAPLPAGSADRLLGGSGGGLGGGGGRIAVPQTGVFQSRVAPPVLDAPAAVPAGAARTAAEPSRPRDRRRGGDDRVPVLLVFEPPRDGAAADAGDA